MNGINFLNRQNSFVKVCIVTLSALVILFGMTKLITKTTNIAQWVFLFVSFFSIWIVFYRAGKGKLIFNILGLIVALLMSFFWLTQPNWLIIDIIGIFIILQLLLGLPRIFLKNLILICIGYLVYDFVAVYFLSTMQEGAVAAVENRLPMLIMIPDAFSLTTNHMLFAMGLGDIALPAILIREELWRSKEYDFPKIIGLPLMPLVLFFGYIIGSVGAGMAVYVFKSPQPALVFIIPSMLLCLGLAYFIVGQHRFGTKQRL